MRILPFDPNEHRHQLLNLVNQHLSAVVPGWTLPMDYFLQHLERNQFQDIVDPWVIERRTICVVQRGQVLAAAHLLRYGDGEAVGERYQNLGDIAWMLMWPEAGKAGVHLLEAVRDQMMDWGVKTVSAFDAALAVPLWHGLPDCWPHIRALLTQGGFGRMHPREEAIYGGWLTSIPVPGNTPNSNINLRRGIQTEQGVALTAYIGDEVIGWCEWNTDLTQGGSLPSLRGWAELTYLFIEDEWRDRGIGAWLVSHAVEWIRLAGCDRVALSVDSEDEGRGAGRFYQRFGWGPLSRLEIGWGYTLFTPT